ncbi:DUF4041 domain-containing protein [Aeromicrobium massiliense]|uniref:DUF4041 domain-containing protein n=1 Tax=Aeromicrobium massiliense TaxID=1464554 RepID=UPI0002F4CCC0|nr:DUF4041 domain-containing protein [Aeromicrobium massiliense]
MGTTVADWYRDPTGRYEFRYWDGARWTEHVATNGQRHQDALPPQPAVGETDKAQPTHETPVAEAPAIDEPDPMPSAATREPEKVTAFNAKKIATKLQSENARLTRLLAELGALDAVERATRIAEQQELETALRAEVQELSAEKERVESDILVARDRISLEELGLFDFEHPAEASASLATELEALRSQIRQANKIGTAITATSGFTFNGSTAKGKTFVNQMSRIMLRAYNAEAENAVKSVKAGNLASAQKRLSVAREQIAKQGTMIDLAVTTRYHHLRLLELELAARHLKAVATAKELERERRAELREQKALEAEITREKERLEKERAHYTNSIERLRAAGDEDGALKLESELVRIDAAIAEADYRVANIRAGYVYVISNIGAFGEGVVKIGMTRRLDPMDRVRELGDASVPFIFDVHALFFSDDAVGVEAMLHREFAAQRLNKVNLRKEFFRVEPQAVLDALQQHNVAVLEFRTHAAADDFRASWPALP